MAQTSIRFYGRDGSQPPVMPKKPQSSYMAFYNEKRSSIMDANPGRSLVRQQCNATEVELGCWDG